MTELKTLKDMEFEVGIEDTITKNVRKQLRQEAIKWILGLEESIKHYKKKGDRYAIERHRDMFQIMWIKQFFNIKDVDLK